MKKSDKILSIQHFNKSALDLFMRFLGKFKDVPEFTVTHWRVMTGVFDEGDEITQTRAKALIQDHVYRSDAKKRAVIKSLVNAGILSKRRDPKDDRVVLISLTDKGKKEVSNYYEQLYDLMKESLVHQQTTQS